MAQKIPDDTTDPTLDAYRFHERDWESYEELYEAFEWEVPETFNIATYCCDRWTKSGRTALITEDSREITEYTFADLQDRANRFATYLRSQGIERGDRVAVDGTQRVEVLATHLACWKLGAISVPLSGLFGPEALRYRLHDSGAKACVITRDGLEAFRAVKDDLSTLNIEVVVDAEPKGDEMTFAAAIDGQPGDHETVETDPEDTAIIFYTSGTTGEPKGVVLPHQHLLGVLPTALCAGNLEMREDDVLRTPVEWSWIGSLSAVVLPTLYYGNPVVGTDLGPFDPECELELLERHKVTITGGPPTAYRVVLNHPAIEVADLSALRVLGLGGEAAGDALVERAREVLPNAAIHEFYGQSEAPYIITDCEALGVPHRSGKMGKPAPGHEVQVVDPDTLEPVDTGEVGELALRRKGNPGCFTEYWNAPEKTAQKVQGEWQLCEDLGLMDEDGYLEFYSRTDDVIISSGYKVSPVEVEDALAAHEAVANAGVIGVPDETRGELVKAFVELAEGRDPSEGLRTELQQFVKDRLAKYEYPRELSFVDELPKTTTGKVRRQRLREREERIETE